MIMLCKRHDQAIIVGMNHSKCSKENGPEKV